MKYKVLVKFGTTEAGSEIELSEATATRLVNKGILSKLDEKKTRKVQGKPSKENIETK